MNWIRRRGVLEVLLLAVILLFATLQIIFSNASNLTTWRGGGFGMYTDPHPRTSRFVWIEGTRDGVRTAVRLYPADERFAEETSHPSQFNVDLNRLTIAARESRDFPAIANPAALKGEIEEFLITHGENDVVLELFPRGDVRLKVVEVLITPDYRHLESRVISDRPLG